MASCVHLKIMEIDHDGQNVFGVKGRSGTCTNTCGEGQTEEKREGFRVRNGKESQ